jgi:hypothetical protein
VSRRSRAIVSLVVTVIVIGVAGVWAINEFSADPAPAASDEDPELTTASVVRTDLIEVETLDGTLRYAEPGFVLAQAPGVVTGTPGEGRILTRGDELMEIGGRPVIVMYGDRPAWRTMSNGIEGSDVEQLEENLAALGFEVDGPYSDEEGPHVDDSQFDDVYDGLTAELVRDWQGMLGLDGTGMVELGSVVFLTGPVRISEVVVDVGTPVAAGTPLLATSATYQEVQLWLDADQQDLLEVGDSVGLEFPDEVVSTGVVEEISSVVTTVGTGPDARRVFEVSIRPDDVAVLEGLDEAPVDVDVESSEATGVLAVPVNALLALAEGGYAVELQLPVGGTRIVAVDIGEFADGLVEVDGELSEGDVVLVPG